MQRVSTVSFKLAAFCNETSLITQLRKGVERGNRYFCRTFESRRNEHRKRVIGTINEQRTTNIGVICERRFDFKFILSSLLNTSCDLRVAATGCYLFNHGCKVSWNFLDNDCNAIVQIIYICVCVYICICICIDMYD